MLFLMLFFVPCTTGIPLWNIFIYTHFYTKWIFHCWVGLKNQPGAFEAKFQPAMFDFWRPILQSRDPSTPCQTYQDIKRLELEHRELCSLSKKQIPTLDIDTSPSASNPSTCWGPNPWRNCCFSNPHVFLVSSVQKNSPGAINSWCISPNCVQTISIHIL